MAFYSMFMFHTGPATFTILFCKVYVNKSTFVITHTDIKCPLAFFFHFSLLGKLENM